ncbi:glycosyltransferase [Pontimicrobium aquaticum]|uniref:Glycosyltransferase family 4 protein n=1 Tax=Pontimicrobium aquaticum TaxID=2565367 RepID=A0A4U0ER39_9FLAO|nr:glycosyltransferase [Pontimicrobium aquaticum]TJY34110.1 glycosyltransferase family 4 protein [Pontimicrobium aquaticum]
MPKLLIIGFVWPEPKSSAAGSRMMQLIQLFLNEGYSISFSSPCAKSDNAFNLEELGVDQIPIELNNPSFDAFISTLKPDVVLFDRFMMEEQFGWRVAEQCPDALRILDTEDLHCLRKGREQAFKDNKPFDNSYLFRDIAKREIASIYRCDFSLIISEAEMSLLKKQFKISDTLLHYLPFLMDEVSQSKHELLPTFNERNHFVTIGNFLHPPNLDSVKFLKESIWPKVRAQLKTAELHVYGAYASEKVMQYQDQKNGLFIKGFADDVNEVMQNSRICLSPLRFGAGLKGKFFDAMYNGTPFITTNIGAEGIINTNDNDDFVADLVDDMVSSAINLYEDESLWNKQQELSFNLLSNKFNKKLHERKFLNKLEDALAKKEVNRLQNFTGAMLNFHTMQSTKYMSRWIEEKNK